MSTQSSVDLLKDTARQTADLVRAEIHVAQAELAAKARSAGAGIGMFAAAAVALFFASGVLVATAIVALDLALPLWLSALIVAVALLLIAAGLGVAGRAALRRGTPAVPERAVSGVREDVARTKDTLRGRS